MPVTIERVNPVITCLPPTARTFLRKCGEVMDQEALASWILNFGIQQLQDAQDQLEEKFLPDELEAIRQAIRELYPSLSVPPLATTIAERVHGTHLLRTQTASLSRAEIFVLTFFVIFDSLLGRTYNGEEYLTAMAFARACRPQISHAWACALCKQGRVPGAFREPGTGRWRIPAAAVNKVLIADRAKRVKGKLVRKKRNKKKEKYQCLKRTSL